MSGGSYDYLFMAETLVGRSGDIEKMAESVLDSADRIKGSKKYNRESRELEDFTADDRLTLLEAARELLKLATWLKHIEHRLAARHVLYSGVLKAVEWTDSGDTGPEYIIEEYLKLVGGEE